MPKPYKFVVTYRLPDGRQDCLVVYAKTQESSWHLGQAIAADLERVDLSDVAIVACALVSVFPRLERDGLVEASH